MDYKEYLAKMDVLNQIKKNQKILDFGFYNEENLEVLDESYINMNLKLKGLNVYTKNNKIIFINEIKEGEVITYQVLTPEDISDEDFNKILTYKKNKSNVLYIISLIFSILLSLLLVYSIFDIIQNGGSFSDFILLYGNLILSTLLSYLLTNVLKKK